MLMGVGKVSRVRPPTLAERLLFAGYCQIQEDGQRNDNLATSKSLLDPASRDLASPRGTISTFQATRITLET